MNQRDAAHSTLRILLMGDFSNYHATLARELRRLGHEVTVVSNGSFWMDTTRDIDITRRLPGKLGGLDLWWRLNRLADSQLAGYDVVSLAGVGFVNLRPERIAKIFDRLRAANKLVVLNMSTCDANYVKACVSPNSPLKYNEWRVNGQPTQHALQSGLEQRWLAPGLRHLADKIYAEADGVFAGLYEYYLTSAEYVGKERLAYGGIPIDTDYISEIGLNYTFETTQLFLGRHRARMVEKGTDVLEKAARIVAEKHPQLCDLVTIENLPYREYLGRMANGDVILDQLYSYSPATNAMIAMSMGKVAVTGGEPEYYDFIGERGLRPIVNADPADFDALVGEIERTVTDADYRNGKARQAREFILRHNDVKVVAQRFLDFVNKLSR